MVKATGKIVMGSPLTVFVSHIVEHLLNSHYTQHLSIIFFLNEILLLMASHITLSHCDNLNPATLLPSEADEAPLNCLTLMTYLLIPPSQYYFSVDNKQPSFCLSLHGERSKEALPGLFYKGLIPFINEGSTLMI